MKPEQYAVFAGHVLGLMALAERLAKHEGGDPIALARQSVRDGCAKFRVMHPDQLQVLLERLSPGGDSRGASD